MVCKNCGTPHSKNQRYCFECGARIIRNRLTLKALFEQINVEFFSVDNKLLKTFLHLFSKPEAVIVGFIEGTRKKYINVVQYFAIALTLIGLQVFLMEKVFNDPALYQSDFFDWLSKLPGQEHNVMTNGEMEFNEVNSLQSIFTTINVPFSALTTWFIFWVTGMRQFNFTEHIVINLYYGAQIGIVTAVIYIICLGLGINFFTIAIFTTAITFIYFVFLLKRVFKLNILNTIAYFVLIMVGFGVLFTLLSIIVALITLLFTLVN